LSAARFAEVVRAHWQIENSLHWVLDVVMDEDQARARKDHAPENLARLRRFALNLLRANPDKGSTRGKFKRAGWDDAFLLKILTSASCDRRGSGADNRCDDPTPVLHVPGVTQLASRFRSRSEA
jgi:hypothetical protein